MHTSRTNDRLDRLVLAHQEHERIAARIEALRKSKVEVYFLLREFKRRRLYRLLDLPAAPRHELRIGAGRRFSTWEDYLAALGDSGISFGYFAELERLEKRFGAGFVRLCGAGVPVYARRILLRAPERVVERVREIVGTNDSAAGKVRAVCWEADRWQSEHDHAYPTWQSPPQRASRYRRQALHWEGRLEALVEQIARVPVDFRRGPAYAAAAAAWREVFERHVAAGIRLARQCLTIELGLSHWRFLQAVEAAWERSRYGPRLAAA
jgi:hypothetical protein